MMWIRAKVQSLRYLRAVRNAGVCRGKAGRHMRRELRRALAEYAKDGGEMTAEALAENFGDPEVYALEYINSMAPEEIDRRITRAQRVKRGVLIAAAVIVLGTLAYYGSNVIEALRPKTLYVSVEITDCGILPDRSGEIPDWARRGSGD